MCRRGFGFGWLWVMVVLVLALSLAVAGCSHTASKPATGGQPQVSQNNGSVTVNTGQGTVQAGGTYQWPSQIPPDVPKFSYGTITAIYQTSATVGTGTTIAMQNVSPDAYDKYQSDLKNAGWTITNNSQSADGFMISATKDTRSVLVSFTNSSDKGLTGALVYTPGQ